MSSTETRPAVPARVGALCRVLLQVRLLLAALTLLFALGGRLTGNFWVAFAGAVFSSWLASRYWDRIAPRLVRHPILVGLDVLISYGILSLGGPLGPFFLFTVVTSAIAGLLYRWRGVAYVCLLQILFYYGALATAVTTPENWTFQTLLGQPAYYPIVAFVGVAVRRLHDEQATSDLARQRAEVAAAAADERARLAREMHDSLAKTLRGIAMAAAALPTWVERAPDRAASESRRLASAAETASREARDLIADLRADQLDTPLADTVREIAERWARRTGVSVTLDCREDADLPLAARYEALAIVREALANVEEHSDARTVRVRLAREAGRVVVEVADDGRGFTVEPDIDRPPESRQGATRGSRYGLVGMRERAGRAGGTLEVTSAPGQGTTVTVAVPVAAGFPRGEDGGDGRPRPLESSPPETRGPEREPETRGNDRPSEDSDG